MKWFCGLGFLVFVSSQTTSVVTHQTLLARNQGRCLYLSHNIIGNSVQFVAERRMKN
jgi:hypothetical protein